MRVRLYWSNGRVEDLKEDIAVDVIGIVRNIDGGRRPFGFRNEFDADGFAIFEEDEEDALRE